MRPDYRRIHELEYELGFRDDPPPSRRQSMAGVDAIVKDMWTDLPAIIREHGSSNVVWSKEQLAWIRR